MAISVHIAWLRVDGLPQLSGSVMTKVIACMHVAYYQARALAGRS
jgi:hypothetical protein